MRNLIDEYEEACSVGNLENIKNILTNKIQTNEYNNLNQGLKNACIHGHLEIVEYLLTSKDLETKPEINESGNNFSALELAYQENQINIFKFMIEDERVNPKPNLRHSRSRILKLAAEKNKLEDIIYLLTNNKLKQHCNLYESDALDIAENNEYNDILFYLFKEYIDKRKLTKWHKKLISKSHNLQKIISSIELNKKITPKLLSKNKSNTKSKKVIKI